MPRILKIGNNTQLTFKYFLNQKSRTLQLPKLSPRGGFASFAAKWIGKSELAQIGKGGNA